jgi:hypothetical protein
MLSSLNDFRRNSWGWDCRVCESCTMSVIRNALSYIVVGSGVVLTAAWTGLLAYAVLRLIKVIL